MPAPTGARRLLETAVAAGVEVCFANPGTTEMPLVAALDEVPALRAVLALFEGVCTGAADGYGRMTGRPALTLLHLGPGLANGVANLHNARRAHTPVVNLVGDQASWHLAFDAPLTSDIASLAAPVSRWVHTSASAKQMAEDCAQAVASARSAPGGVSTLILPADFQGEEAGGPAPPRDPEPLRPVPGERVDAAAARLRAAGSGGVLLIGGGALAAGPQRSAARVAAGTGARVVVETFPARHERGAGLPAFERLPYFPEQAREMLAGAEVVVLAGAREPVAFFGYPGQPSEVVPPGAAQVLAAAEDDVVASLDALADAVDAPTGDEAPPAASLPPSPEGKLSAGSIGAVLAAALPENAIVVDEAATTGLPFSLMAGAAARHTALSLTGGSIGQGLPCATGAAIACPDRKVVAFQADGSAAYTVQSLWTQARESLDVVTLLCSNRSYRILQVELARAGIPEPGRKALSLTQLDGPPIDWVALAKGFGVPGVRAETAEELRGALARAFAEPGPRLVEMAIS